MMLYGTVGIIVQKLILSVIFAQTAFVHCFSVFVQNC